MSGVWVRSAENLGSGKRSASGKISALVTARCWRSQARQKGAIAVYLACLQLARIQLVSPCFLGITPYNFAFGNSKNETFRGKQRSQAYNHSRLAVMKIIRATPGPNTSDRLLELVAAHPEGITLRELCLLLNRPVSMLQHCLKEPIASGKIVARLSPNGMRRIYFPGTRR